jgi:hypothetical protein
MAQAPATKQAPATQQASAGRASATAIRPHKKPPKAMQTKQAEAPKATQTKQPEAQNGGVARNSANLVNKLA